MSVWAITPILYMPICIVDIHVCCRFGNIQNKAIQETSKSIKLERKFTGKLLM